MTRAALLIAVLLAGCAVSTDSFRGRGRGDWVKDEPFTASDLDRDRNHCRSLSYEIQDDRVDGSYAGAADAGMYSMMRARQALEPCLRSLGWKRRSEQMGLKDR